MHYKKGHYSLIIIPHPDPPASFNILKIILGIVCLQHFENGHYAPYARA